MKIDRILKKVKRENEQRNKLIREYIDSRYYDIEVKTRHYVEAMEWFKNEILESFNQIYTKQGVIALIDEMIQIIQETGVE